MDLHRLRIFLAAADELSFRQAAVLMGVGQPVVSRQVAALEDELGVTLFERRSTGARLTEAGRVFLWDARRIVADVGRAREAVACVAHGTAGRLRLAICEDATAPTFASILTTFRKHCPTTDLDLFELPSAMQPAAIRRGEIDVGLLLPPVQDQGFSWTNSGATVGWSPCGRIIDWRTLRPSRSALWRARISSRHIVSSVPAVMPKVRPCSARQVSTRASLPARSAG